MVFRSFPIKSFMQIYVQTATIADSTRDRLPTDRIPASEAGNTGSIPVGRTTIVQSRTSVVALLSEDNFASVLNFPFHIKQIQLRKHRFFCDAYAYSQ